VCEHKRTPPGAWRDVVVLWNAPPGLLLNTLLLL
jgi:hypothetical protein